MSPVYIRASDDDRERVVDELRRHAAEGRLEVAELEERIERALAARTQGELAVLTRDLPERQPEVPAPAPAPRRRSRARPELGLFVAVMSLLIVIWAVSGAGYFWPIWPLVGWGFFVLGPGRAFGVCGGRHRRRRSARGWI